MPSRLRRFDEPGHTHFWTISCYRRLQFFHDDGMKRVVINALRTLRTQMGICLIAYVVMPVHVHVLLYPHARGDDDPADWKWSSYRFYEFGDSTLLAMDWDGCWPIGW